ncbi:quaternary amine ABC transporter ATP-binding protein [Blastococcus colisei]|uniref:quaternary amine ABC transporter ATP-binding protein n=1 Tax=Blastococcus colisei TaxID=1564162 RepID=UPI001FE9451D|nr:betaine/proline/choline family ABC transporter ATP-binding protein [Blastococcus colisei]
MFKVFGRQPEQAVARLRQGASAAELRAAGSTAAVIDVSFSADPGEIFVVMGLSGSGKSTLIRMLNGLLAPTAGRVHIGDTELTALDPAGLRRLRQEHISMVFQHFALLPHRSVAENAAYALEVRGVDRRTRLAAAREALELVGLQGWADHRPDQLSGGMQQRVGLARALAAETDVLLMDEAFSALDPLIRREMQDQLLELQRRFGKTIIFITHDLNEAMRIGDRIAVMRDGRIVRTGTPGEILAEPGDEYVASFLADVDRARVFTASDVMTPLPADVDATASTVSARAPLADLLTTAAGTDRPLVVEDSGGRRLGVVTRTALLAALGGETPDGDHRPAAAAGPRQGPQILEGLRA